MLMEGARHTEILHPPVNTLSHQKSSLSFSSSISGSSREDEVEMAYLLRSRTI